MKKLVLTYLIAIALGAVGCAGEKETRKGTVGKRTTQVAEDEESGKKVGRKKSGRAVKGAIKANKRLNKKNGQNCPDPE